MRVDLESRPVIGPTTRRVVAGSAVLLAVAGAAGLIVATAGDTRLTRYVSESGVIGAPGAGLYRLSMFGVACAVALAAVALRGSSGSAAGLLAGAALCVVVSGSVPCTTGCPLPPYETPTLADLVHAGASIAGLTLVGGAMLVLALPGVDRPVRLAGRAGLAVAVPLLAAAGLSMLFLGRGATTGVLERAALVATLGWLIAVSATGAFSRGPGAGRRLPPGGANSGTR
ncbi:MAG TPA: DUF998 domain-containing protein [Planosporangium sp.]|nr:DUF998 domain-containing protein [Planosporangium sp.]